MMEVMTRTTSTYDRIIAATEKLWRAAHNISKVSLAEIAREAGVSETTLYNTIGTREQLVQDVITHITDELVSRQRAVAASDAPLPVKIQSLISNKMQAMGDIQTDLLDKMCADPAVKAQVEWTIETKVKPIMRSVIAQGREEGYIRKETPDEVIFLYFDILRAGNASCSAEVKRLVGDNKLAEAFIKLVYFGLFAREFEITVPSGKPAP